MIWEIQYHPDVVRWMMSLSFQDYENVLAALEALRLEGPSLGRPFVDHIKGSRYRNMKELRPRGKSFRLLFAFDPRRSAVILVAGDKSGNWRGWYEENIAVADSRFDEYLSNLDWSN
jgi:hypothetical protein